MVARLNVRLLNGLSCFEPRGGGVLPILDGAVTFPQKKYLFQA